MAIARIASQNCGTYSTSSAIQFAMPNSVTSGNTLMFVYAGYRNASTPGTIGISRYSGAATVGAEVTDINMGTNVSSDYIRLMIARVPVTGDGALTLSLTTTAESWSLGINEYSGLDNIDGAAGSSSATGTSVTTGDLTGHTGGLMVGGQTFMTSGTYVYSSLSDNNIYSVTNNSNYQAHLFQDRLVTGNETHAITNNISISSLWISTGAAYTASAVAPHPLIDVTSGTAAGFLSNGGTTDPFTSGSAVVYTVQSALTTGSVYYWRVRGIDPTGSNSYGDWSSIRSLTIGTAAAGTPSLNVYRMLMGVGA